MQCTSSRSEKGFIFVTRLSSWVLMLFHCYSFHFFSTENWENLKKLLLLLSKSCVISATLHLSRNFLLPFHCHSVSNHLFRHCECFKSGISFSFSHRCGSYKEEEISVESHAYPGKQDEKKWIATRIVWIEGEKSTFLNHLMKYSQVRDMTAWLVFSFFLPFYSHFLPSAWLEWSVCISCGVCLPQPKITSLLNLDATCDGVWFLLVVVARCLLSCERERLPSFSLTSQTYPLPWSWSWEVSSFPHVNMPAFSAFLFIWNVSVRCVNNDITAYTCLYIIFCHAIFVSSQIHSER